MTINYVSEQFRVQVVGSTSSTAAREVLTPNALRFLGTLATQFEHRRQSLLKDRVYKAQAIDAGELPHFLTPDRERDPHWTCAPVPEEVQDRRVEITGPVDRKMVINGLNSGANVYMADFEDSTSPTWSNVVEGQQNLMDAVRGTITFIHPVSKKMYRLNPDKTAILFVRPRGWHLIEAHVLVNGQPISASLFDFGLYLFHNAHVLSQKGSRPYFYLPKLESHKEACLWNDVFVTAQEYLGMRRGDIRATVLLETITASFEMEEILYELREHSLGLNCGRWDYLFSFIKKFKHHSDKIAPDRSVLTMTTPLMQAYVQKLIETCHRRQTFAMGGMSAFIPIRDNPTANAAAMEKVKVDKLREVQAGHDGTWVAHPALVKVAKEVFDNHLGTAANQIKTPPNANQLPISEAALLRLPDNISATTTISSENLKRGVGIVLAYVEAWLRGVGCIPLHNAMEDAATAEISRAQVWQWRTHGIRTCDDQQLITAERLSKMIRDLVVGKEQSTSHPDFQKWRLAGHLVDQMLNSPKLDDFLTTVCYPYIVQYDHGSQMPSKL